MSDICHWKPHAKNVPPRGRLSVAAANGLCTRWRRSQRIAGVDVANVLGAQPPAKARETGAQGDGCCYWRGRTGWAPNLSLWSRSYCGPSGDVQAAAVRGLC